MAFKRYSVMLGLRLVVLTLLLVALAWFVTTPGYNAALLLTLAVLLALGFELHRFVTRTNRELARFLDAARYEDFGQRFALQPLGAGFEELGDVLAAILARFQREREAGEQEHRQLKALLEQVPVPLISIRDETQVLVWNNAARRLFGTLPVARLDDLRQCGEDFHRAVCEIGPGEKRLVTFTGEGFEQLLTLSASEVLTPSARERLISLQNIQSELDGMQLRAWQDLVRVLTHEIMNSITPVTSLAKTAADLVQDAERELGDSSPQQLEQARQAVDTVARRSDDLLGFVGSYRKLTRMPDASKTNFALAMVLEDVRRVACVDWADRGVTLHCDIAPESLELYADRTMVEQVLINLLQNAEQALENAEAGDVQLRARLNRAGRVALEVSDNGPGIAEDILPRIFVPFFTTRREGSGVGLALARQIMIAHGGVITAANNPEGGARFTLVF